MMPSLSRLPARVACRFLLPALLVSACGVAAGATLADLVPASAQVVLHVPSVPALARDWERTPIVRTWRDEAVQRFFQPLRERWRLAEWDARLAAETGLTPAELLALFPGEALVAVVNVAPGLRDGSDARPRAFLAADVGGNGPRIAGLLSERRPGRATEDTVEEFQGELLHQVWRTDGEGGERQPAFAWAIVDDVLLAAEPLSLLQATVAALKRGGAAEPLADSPALQAVRARQPDAQLTLFIHLERLLPALLEQVEQRSAGAAPNPLGITPAGLYRALGLAVLRSFHLSAAIGPDATEVDLGVQFSARRGLVSVAAYGEPPAPRPDWVPASWATVNADRFSVPAALAAVEEIIRSISPAVDGLFQVQLQQWNRRLGIDLKRDLVGSLGGEVINGHAFRQEPGSDAVADALRNSDQLIAISVSNPDALNLSLEAIKAAFPPLAARFTRRPYLGESIHTFTPPPAPGGAPGTGAPAASSFSYAATRSTLFLSLGSAAPLEAALQGLAGDRPSIWARPDVGRAIAALPPGASSVSYQDLRRWAVAAFDAMVAMPVRLGPSGGTDRPGPPWDPAAKPPAEAIARHWGAAVGGIYVERNGLFSRVRLEHPE